MTVQDTKKSDWLRSLISVLLGILIGAVATAAFSGYFVRRYIDRNPEVVGDAIRELEARQTASIIDPHRRALETPYHGGWAGAARPEVVLVELFDYACSFCRASNPHVEQLKSLSEFNRGMGLRRGHGGLTSSGQRQDSIQRVPLTSGPLRDFS